MVGTHGSFNGGYVYERNEELSKLYPMQMIEMLNDDLRFGLQ